MKLGPNCAGVHGGCEPLIVPSQIVREFMRDLVQQDHE